MNNIPEPSLRFDEFCAEVDILLIDYTPIPGELYRPIEARLEELYLVECSTVEQAAKAIEAEFLSQKE